MPRTIYVQAPDDLGAAYAVAAPTMPTLVQYVSCSYSNTSDPQTVSEYDIPILPTRAGNCVVVGFQYGVSAGVTAAVSDDKGNSYTQVESFTETTNQQIINLYVFPNIGAGAQRIKVAFSGGTPQFVLGGAIELSGIAVSPVDVHNHAIGSSTSVTAGSITPTQTSDVIVQYTCVTNAPLTSYASGSNSNITWSLTTTDIHDGSCFQWGIDSAAVAINPALTISPSKVWGSCSVALKTSAGAGTPRPATGIQIIGMQHINTVNETDGSVTTQWPTLGNCQVCSFICGTPRKISSISDGTNSWSQIGTGAANNSEVQFFYAPNSTPSLSESVTFTMSSTNPGGFGDTFILYDIANANTAPLDTSVTNTGNDGGPSDVTSLSITPGQANGLVLCNMGVNTDSVYGCTTTGAIFTTSTWLSTGGAHEAVPTHDDENNGWAAVFNSNTTAISFTWHRLGGSGGFNTWASMAISLKP